MPAGFLSPALQLQSPQATQGAAPDPADERPTDTEYERPKGKLHLYWGCGDAVRPGQPRVVDFATATPADLARFFQSRHATQRGTHAAVGRPVWPSAADTRMVPAQASLVGEHGFTGQGVPEGLRFQIPAAQDLMPPLRLQQTDVSGVTQLEWQPLAQARAYFISGMGVHGEGEMVLWTSSEQPDIGFGLMDYQTNPAADQPAHALGAGVGRQGARQVGDDGPAGHALAGRGRRPGRGGRAAPATPAQGGQEARRQGLAARHPGPLSSGRAVPD